MPTSLLLIVILAGVLLLATLWLSWRFYQKQLAGLHSPRKPRKPL